MRSDPDREEVEFVYPFLEGGEQMWKDKSAVGDADDWTQFYWAARMFAGFVHEALGENTSPTPAELRVAFDVAAKKADGTDRWPFDERMGSFSLGSGVNLLVMLHDVWVHGPAMHQWCVGNIATCPAQASHLATLSLSGLMEARRSRWEGPSPEQWTPFALIEGVTWDAWLRVGPRGGVSAWSMAVTTAFVAQIEVNLATIPFAAAADHAHERVIQMDFRPRGMTMADYKQNRMWEVSFCIRRLEDFWPRFAELKEWARTSRLAEAYGTNAQVKPRGNDE